MFCTELFKPPSVFKYRPLGHVAIKVNREESISSITRAGMQGSRGKEIQNF